MVYRKVPQVKEVIVERPVLEWKDKVVQILTPVEDESVEVEKPRTKR